ncbi:MAG: class I SAM-dependent methyltransferase [Candidatus Thorarchaeota archaeon]|nr:class I SAM-dependent methyltransferase [Candidatus Thorarchaeota archaeon]
MNDYYSERLSSNNLKKCYDIAPPRVKQYLRAEIEYVQGQLQKTDSVFELGCGYGRVLKQLLPYSSSVIGIDTSNESLLLAKDYVEQYSRCQVFQANAESLPLSDESIDKVVCIQNGISAFKVDPLDLLRESIRITRKGGLCLFSSYSEKFWEHRIDWFKLQAEAGLIGEIDWNRTSDGVISCMDGFTATTFTPEDFTNLSFQLNLDTRIIEIDSSSIFCVISV